MENPISFTMETPAKAGGSAMLFPLEKKAGAHSDLHENIIKDFSKSLIDKIKSQPDSRYKIFIKIFSIFNDSCFIEKVFMRARDDVIRYLNKEETTRNLNTNAVIIFFDVLKNNKIEVIFNGKDIGNYFLLLNGKRKQGLNKTCNKVSEIKHIFDTFVNLHNENEIFDKKIINYPESSHNDSGIDNIKSEYPVSIDDWEEKAIKENPNNSGNIREAARRMRWCFIQRGTELDLAGLGLTDLPEGIDTWPSSLEKIILDDNHFTEIPSVLYQLPLKKVSLRNNSIEHLDNMPAIKDNPPWISSLWNINLENNNIKQIPEALFRCKKLTKLSLGHNALSHLSGLEKKDWKHIRRLDLSNNRFTKIPPELFELEGLKKEPISRDYKEYNDYQRMLDMSNNHIVDLDERLFDLERINWLNLSGNRLGEGNINSLDKAGVEQMTGLHELYLANNAITDTRSALIQKDTLYVLDLSHSDKPENNKRKNELVVTDSFLEFIEKMANRPGYKELLLDNNKLIFDCKDRSRPINDKNNPVTRLFAAGQKMGRFYLAGCDLNENLTMEEFMYLYQSFLDERIDDKRLKSIKDGKDIDAIFSSYRFFSPDEKSAVMIYLKKICESFEKEEIKILKAQQEAGQVIFHELGHYLNALSDPFVTQHL